MREVPHSRASALCADQRRSGTSRPFRCTSRSIRDASAGAKRRETVPAPHAGSASSRCGSMPPRTGKRRSRVLPAGTTPVVRRSPGSEISEIVSATARRARTVAWTGRRMTACDAPRCRRQPCTWRAGFRGTFVGPAAVSTRLPRAAAAVSGRAAAEGADQVRRREARKDRRDGDQDAGRLPCVGACVAVPPKGQPVRGSDRPRRGTSPPGAHRGRAGAPALEGNTRRPGVGWVATTRTPYARR